MGLEGGLTQPLVIVGFNRLVILITYDMKYFIMDAVSLASILAQNRPSSHMWHQQNKLAKFNLMSQKLQLTHRKGGEKGLALLSYVALQLCQWIGSLRK